MAEVTVKPVESETEWEGFMATHPEANFLHSWYWGNFHQALGHEIERRGYYDGNKLVGISQLVVEPARRGRHIVIAGGPILDWSNKTLVHVWMHDIKLVAKAHKCLFVRVRPQLLATPENITYFHQLGFRKAPMHVTADLTSQLDLRKTDEEIRREMRKGTRYELNQAGKLGVKVESTTEGKWLEEFINLQVDTARRQKFVPFSKKFLTEQFTAFAVVNKVLMYRAISADNKLLAMAFIIFYGQEAAYHYGASTDLAREIPGAYAIQWEAIQEARHRGCSRYNFWGVTEHGQTGHRFYGVSVFKRGFGGEDVAYVPAQDLVVDKFRYSATFTFETARRKIRKL